MFKKNISASSKYKPTDTITDTEDIDLTDTRDVNINHRYIIQDDKNNNILLEIDFKLPILRRSDGLYTLKNKGPNFTYKVNVFRKYITLPLGRSYLTLSYKPYKVIDMIFEDFTTVIFKDEEIDKYAESIKAIFLKDIDTDIATTFSIKGGSKSTHPLQKTNRKIQINGQSRVVYLNKYNTEYIKYKSELIPLKKAMRLETAKPKSKA